MKKLTTFGLLALMMISFLGSCKKEKNDTESLSFEKTDYQPYEIAQLSATNLSMSGDEYDGLIDEEVSVSLTNVEGVLVLTIPGLDAGSHSLTVSIDGKDYEATFNSSALSSIADPDVVISTTLGTYNTQITELTELIDSMSTVDTTVLLGDLQIIQSYIDDANQLLATASAEEKEIAAQFLQANQWWMDELNTAVSDLTIATNLLKNNGVEDYEQKASDAMFNFVNAVVDVVAHVPKLAKIATGGALAGGAAGSVIPGVGTGVGAAIGAGIAIGNALSDMTELNASIDNLLDASITPFQNLFAERLVGGAGVSYELEHAENNKMQVNASNPVQFTVGQSKSLTVTQDYRSLYSADGTNTTPVVESFVNASTSLLAPWDNLMGILPTPLQFGPQTVDGISSYSTENKQVHSNHLTISNVSNSALTYSIDGADGFFNITFSGNVTGTENFTFDVNYSNAEFGAQSYTVSATISAPCTPTNGTFTDARDGETYQTVTLCGQTWFAENLRYNAAGSFYNMNNPDPKYGRLYDWSTALTACPSGWHLPTDAEWITLEMALGLSASEANISGQARGTHGTGMKSTTGWSNNGNGDNSSGFNAIPAGFYYSGSYNSLGDNAYFWSSEYAATRAWSHALSNGLNGVSRFDYPKSLGYSCRCLQD